MNVEAMNKIKSVAKDFYMGTIQLEDATQQVMTALHRWQSSEDIILPYLVSFMIGIADDLLAAVICPVLGYFCPPKDVVDILRDLAEMFVICDNTLEGDIILYRGVNDFANHGINAGYSYTTDINVAISFANGEFVADRWAIKAPHGTVYKVRIPLKYVIGKTNDRNEAEVMVLPPDAGGFITVIDKIRV